MTDKGRGWQGGTASLYLRTYNQPSANEELVKCTQGVR